MTQLKNAPADAGDMGSTPGSERSPGEVNSLTSILAWEIPWTEGSGGPQSMGLQRVGHDSLFRTEQQQNSNLQWKHRVLIMGLPGKPSVLLISSFSVQIGCTWFPLLPAQNLDRTHAFTVVLL